MTSRRFVLFHRIVILLFSTTTVVLADENVDGGGMKVAAICLIDKGTIGKEKSCERTTNARRADSEEESTEETNEVAATDVVEESSEGILNQSLIR